MAKIAIIVGRAHGCGAMRVERGGMIRDGGGPGKGKLGQRSRRGRGGGSLERALSIQMHARASVVQKVLTAPRVRVISDILFRMGNRTDEN